MQIFEGISHVAPEPHGGKEAVSLVYTAVSLAALGFTFTIPMLVRRLSRRWAYSLGATLLGLYAVLLALDAPPALVLGMFGRTAGAALLNVTLSLYIMDAIGKRELTRSEPLRLAVATLAWGLAPFIGVSLMQSWGLWAPAGAKDICRASGGNLGEAAWLAPKAPGQQGRVYLAGREEYGIPFAAPIASDTPYLKDAQVAQFTLMESVRQGATIISFEMTAGGRAYFGERRTPTTSRR